MQLEPGMYVLLMNDMRQPHVEDTQPVVCGHTAEEILALLEQERHEGGWTDEQIIRTDEGGIGMGRSKRRWAKAFKKGSPLEWYNCSYWTVEELRDSRWERIIRYEPNVPEVPSVAELGGIVTDGASVENPVGLLASE